MKGTHAYESSRISVATAGGTVTFAVSGVRGLVYRDLWMNRILKPSQKAWSIRAGSIEIIYLWDTVKHPSLKAPSYYSYCHYHNYY